MTPANGWRGYWAFGVECWTLSVECKACASAQAPLLSRARSSMLTNDAIQQQLRTVKYPGFSRDIVSFGIVKEVSINGSEVTVQLALATNDPEIPKQIKTETEAALAALPGVTSAIVRIDIQAPKQQAMGAQ